MFNAKAAVVVQHSSEAEVARVAASLKASGPTEQVLIDLAALTFPNLQAIRDFMWDVAPHLSGEQLHQVNDYLTRDYFAKNGADIAKFCKSDTLVRLLLTYEGVHHREQAVKHANKNGAIYSNLTYLETGALLSGAIPLPLAMEEFGTILFQQIGVDYSSYPNDAAILKANRVETSENAIYLNSIDKFIIKYSIAELDETRKTQKNRLMDDGLADLSTYRGGRKKAVGLSVRQAIVTGSDIRDAFQTAISLQLPDKVENDELVTGYQQFFDGGTDKFLPEPLFSVLEAAVPSAVPSVVPGMKG